jgi:hypothetical protein
MRGSLSRVKKLTVKEAGASGRDASCTPSGAAE